MRLLNVVLLVDDEGFGRHWIEGILAQADESIISRHYIFDRGEAGYRRFNRYLQDTWSNINRPKRQRKERPIHDPLLTVLRIINAPPPRNLLPRYNATR